MNIHPPKKHFRAEALAHRDNIPEPLRAEKSAAIAQAVCSHVLFQNADCIFVYVAFRSEVATRMIIETALQQRKTVCVPLTDKTNHRIVPYEISDMSKDLHPGTWGIPEPDTAACRRIAPDKIDLVIVPGAAFTVQGWRIGYGGGFYDRFLSAAQTTSCAPAFEEQVSAALPCDSFDVPVDLIVTEKRVIDCKALRNNKACSIGRPVP